MKKVSSLYATMPQRKLKTCLNNTVKLANENFCLSRLFWAALSVMWKKEFVYTYVLCRSQLIQNAAVRVPTGTRARVETPGLEGRF